ncbi:pyridoxal phosphate-dependent aminotransferase [Micromonospora olivasterospora]|uniref:Aspartate/methionine/tyrosine aminotransferase n=1 Tax=Micromonospora olivasterospora TaxID=1880 RepID=A0A562IBW9_MICOL|nr:pyridoxal phosphate-dependent aminotransferase [Micromonospora olivasterospora]TWH68114.1 aspartate/methionine/tyrosine aminotransferase [Micromonospora olivasterospora]
MVLQRDMARPENDLAEQRLLVRQIRRELVQEYRARLETCYEPPIRMMASLVQALERECAERHLDETATRLEIVNRTIGDVNLRLVSECDGAEGGPGDYRRLADELGVALPGENLQGYVATGAVYHWLRDQMLEAERDLMDRGCDPRVYDIASVGNPVLRGWLADDMRQWGLTVGAEHIALGLGATDCMDKVLRGLGALARLRSEPAGAVLLPTPGFNMVESQAAANGYQLHSVETRPEDSFKLTAEQLAAALDENPEVSVLYLTVTSNPSTFAYQPDELLDLLGVLRLQRQRGRTVYLMADLAYVGTGVPAEDEARMRALSSAADLADQVSYVSSLSKTHTLTGERFAWVTFGDADLAGRMVGSWINSTVSMPGEWQLRFMAYHRLFRENPQLLDKVRSLYGMRRARLRAQLRRLDEQYQLFEHIYLDDDTTIYNWSKLREGEDCFSVLEKTGIAGIPGSTFGYSDQYVRFSVGILPVVLN